MSEQNEDSGKKIDVAKIMQDIRAKARIEASKQEPPPIETPMIEMEKTKVDDIDKSSSPEIILKTLESYMEQINHTYDTVSKDMGSDAINANLAAINEAYAIATEVKPPASGRLLGKIRNRMFSGILQSICEQFNNALSQQVKFNSHLVQILNVLISGLQESFSRQGAFNSRVAVYTQNLMPGVQHLVSEGDRMMQRDYQQLIIEKYNQLAGKINQNNEKLVHRSELLMSHLDAKLDGVMQTWKEMAEYIEQLQRADNQLHRALEEFNIETSKELRRLKEYYSSNIEGLMRSFQLHKNRLDRILSTISKETLSKEDKKQLLKERESNQDFNYFNFEAEYRGSQEEITKRQKIYLDYIETRTPVVDVGCGRGEFLELLQKNGIVAFGIDINEEMVELCAKKGLKAFKGDFEAGLAKFEDASLGAIFAAQVVEHLTPSQITSLVKLSYKKLKDGGTMIIETINPRSLHALLNAYLLDLSHVQPVHPEAIKFLALSNGFSKCEIIELNPVPDHYMFQGSGIRKDLIKDSLLSTALEGLDADIKRLNEIFFAPQDYALLAYK